MDTRKSTIAYNQTIKIEDIVIQVRVNLSLVTDLQELTEATDLRLSLERLAKLRHKKTNYEDALRSLRVKKQWTEQSYIYLKLHYNEILQTVWANQAVPILKERQLALVQERQALEFAKREQRKRDEMWLQQVERRWHECLIQGQADWLLEVDNRWKSLEQCKQDQVDKLWCNELKKKIQGRRWTNAECEWLIERAIKGEEIGVLATLLPARPPLWKYATERERAYEALTAQVRDEMKRDWVSELFQSNCARTEWEAEQQRLVAQQKTEQRLEQENLATKLKHEQVLRLVEELEKLKREKIQEEHETDAEHQREIRERQLHLEQERQQEENCKRQQEQEWQRKAHLSAELKVKQEAVERQRVAQAQLPIQQQPTTFSPFNEGSSGAGCILPILGIIAFTAILPFLLQLLAFLVTIVIVGGSIVAVAAGIFLEELI